jgi:hypothetical protein
VLPAQPGRVAAARVHAERAREPVQRLVHLAIGRRVIKCAPPLARAQRYIQS